LKSSIRHTQSHFPARFASGSAENSANNMIGCGKLNGAAYKFIG